MMRKFVSASLATALLLGSVSPAFAQNYAFAPDQAPLGMTATFNLKVPLGAAPTKERKPNYGLTFGYNHSLNSLTEDGRIATHQAKLADFRFTDGFKLWKAEVATFDLANLDKDPRLNLADDSMGGTTWIVVGLVAAGVAVCLLADCFDGDDDDEDEDEDDEGSESPE